MLQVLTKAKCWLHYRFFIRMKPWLDRVVLKAEMSTEDIYTYIYTHNLWGDPDSVSGTGSNLTQTRVLRQRLPALLKELRVQSLLDIPCGDYHWLSRVELDLRQYLGADIVRPLVQSNQARYGRQTPRASTQFEQMNLLTTPLPCVDLILCRDCLVHFTSSEVAQALRQFKQSGSTYLLTTTYPSQPANKDIRSGGWRPLNLQAAPFNWPEPLQVLSEQCDESAGRLPAKALGLWKVADLPDRRVQRA